MKGKIILPIGIFGANEHDTLLDTFLRQFAITHSKEEGEWAEKYGTNYEDKKTVMNTYCWCYEDECKLCSGEMPNFWYKPLDFTVSWYKYIGREMDTNKKLTKEEFQQMIKDCIN